MEFERRMPEDGEMFGQTRFVKTNDGPTTAEDQEECDGPISSLSIAAMEDVPGENGDGRRSKGLLDEHHDAGRNRREEGARSSVGAKKQIDG